MKKAVYDTSMNSEKLFWSKITEHWANTCEGYHWRVLVNIFCYHVSSNKRNADIYISKQKKKKNLWFFMVIRNVSNGIWYRWNKTFVSHITYSKPYPTPPPDSKRKKKKEMAHRQIKINSNYAVSKPIQNITGIDRAEANYF